ncbi:hypothetical protein Tco_0267424 [Tanacetum coccineum]
MYNKETVELKQCLDIIPDEEEVTIDAIPFAVKSLKIIDWKIHTEGKKSYYQIIRADGKSQMYMIFSQMLKSFDMEDLEDLYKLVKARYGSSRPVESMDCLLWNDMQIMFELHVEDEPPSDPANLRPPSAAPKKFSGEYSGRAPKRSPPPDLLDPLVHAPPHAYIHHHRRVTTILILHHRRCRLTTTPQPTPPYAITTLTFTPSQPPPSSSSSSSSYHRRHQPRTTTTAAPLRVRMV